MSIKSSSYVLSFIIPSLNVPKELECLIGKIVNIGGAEVILVNQNPGKNLLKQRYSGLNEIVVEPPVSASDARNIGALAANGDFLFFLDDDADLLGVSDCLIDHITKLARKCDVIIFDRCYYEEGALHSYNPPIRRWQKEHWYMAKFVTEWNICIRRSVFFSAGMFPRIGTGSNSKAQSGEIFVLFSKICSITTRINYLPEMAVIHPRYTGAKPLIKCLGYYYGAGYSVGLSVKYFSVPMRVVWIIRTLAAAVRDIFLPERFLLKPTDSGTNLIYRIRICYSRSAGLINGLVTA